MVHKVKPQLIVNKMLKIYCLIDLLNILIDSGEFS